MKCNHEIEHLVGKSDGILCKKCGRVFVNFAEIEKDRDGEKSLPKTDIPENTDEAEGDIKKPEKTEVPAQSSTAKGSKPTKKKAVSKVKKSEKE